jgi:hypothetical protein
MGTTRRQVVIGGFTHKIRRAVIQRIPGRQQPLDENRRSSRFFIQLFIHALQ